MASSWPATAYMLHRKEVPALLRAPLVANIARSLGKRPAQVLIRWALQHGTSVSPKAGSHEHVQVCFYTLLTAAPGSLCLKQT